jgi:hypothetical protein
VSYDLDFLVRPDQDPPTAPAFREYFRSRRWYEDQGEQLGYANADTGVYFSFHLGAAAPACLSFNINYFRPHVFGLEATRELAAVAAHFSLLVDDPQIGGMGRGAFTNEGFLGGWNAGNLEAHRALLSSRHEGHEPIAHHSLPAAVLERIWRWNHDRLRLQDALGKVFVPKISFLQRAGTLRTFVVWSDAIPVALPDVDLLVLVRNELAPRRGLRWSRDVCLVTTSEAAPILQDGRREAGPSPYTLFDRVLLRAVSYFRRQAPFDGGLDGLALDQVLTRELLEEAGQAAAGREPADEGIPRPPDTKPS